MMAIMSEWLKELCLSIQVELVGVVGLKVVSEVVRIGGLVRVVGLEVVGVVGLEVVLVGVVGLEVPVTMVSTVEWIRRMVLYLEY